MRTAAAGLLLAASALASCGAPDGGTEAGRALARDLTLADPSSVLRFPAESLGAVISPVERGIASPQGILPAVGVPDRPHSPEAVPAEHGLVPASGPPPRPMVADGPVAVMPLAAGQTVAVVPRVLPGGLPWDDGLGADALGGGRSGTRVIVSGGGICVPRGGGGLGSIPRGVPTRQL